MVGGRALIALWSSMNPARLSPLRTRVGGVAFLLAALSYLLAETVAAAAWRTPPYDYAVNYISDLGVAGCGVEYSGRVLCSPLFAVMNAGFIVDGLLFLLAGVLLAPLLGPRLRVLFVVAVVLHSTGNVLVGLFDETTGAIAAGLLRTHVVGATLAILFGNVAAIVAGSWGIRSGRRLGWVAVLLGAVGIVALVPLAAGGLGSPEGTVERVSVYAITAFELLAGASALWLARNRSSS